jgi:hypothetical protein
VRDFGAERVKFLFDGGADVRMEDRLDLPCLHIENDHWELYDLAELNLALIFSAVALEIVDAKVVKRLLEDDFTGLGVEDAPEEPGFEYALFSGSRSEHDVVLALEPWDTFKR